MNRAHQEEVASNLFLIQPTSYLSTCTVSQTTAELRDYRRPVMCISVRRSGVKWGRRIHSTRCQAAWHGDTPPKSQTRRYLDSIIAVRLVRQPHRRSAGAGAGSPQWADVAAASHIRQQQIHRVTHDMTCGRRDWSWWEAERNGNETPHCTAVTVMYVFRRIHRSRV